MEAKTTQFLFGNSKGKAQIIARIAIMLTSTVVVQFAVGKLGSLIPGAQQILTGSFVNLFLFLSALLCGLVGGISIGIVTPFIALLLGINPNIVLVPFIAVSNAVMVSAFSLVCYFLKLDSREKVLENVLILVIGFVLGAVLKFMIMYFVCVRLILPLFVEAEILSGNAVTALAVSWGIIQLATACIGGAVMAALYYPLKKVGLLNHYYDDSKEKVDAQQTTETIQPEEEPKTEEPKTEKPEDTSAQNQEK